jgi:hypothetical protein
VTATTGPRPLVLEDPASIAAAIDVTTEDRTTMRSHPMTVRRDRTACAVSVGCTRGDRIDVTGSIQTIAWSRMPMIDPDDFITEDRMARIDPVKAFPGPIVTALASEESFRRSAKDVPSVDQCRRSPTLNPTRSRVGIT